MSDATVAKKPRETDDVPVPPTLARLLKNRHIQLIALRRDRHRPVLWFQRVGIQLAGPGHSCSPI